MEKLSFKITLDCEYHPDFQKIPPTYIIKINNDTVGSGEVTKETVVAFEYECPEHSKLIIKMLGKSKYDVVLGDDGLPIKDKLLKITKIEIDDINIEKIVRTQSQYTPDDQWYLEQNRSKFPLPITGIDKLGWNGVWSLKFTTPLYSWLLKNI